MAEGIDAVVTTAVGVERCPPCGHSRRKGSRGRREQNRQEAETSDTKR